MAYSVTNLRGSGLSVEHDGKLVVLGARKTEIFSDDVGKCFEEFGHFVKIHVMDNKEMPKPAGRPKGSKNKKSKIEEKEIK